MLRKRSVRFLALAAISTCAAASGAWADGMEGSLKDTAAPAPTYAWSGLSVGVGIGAGNFDHGVWTDASRKDFFKKKECFFKWWFWKCEIDKLSKEREQHGHFGDNDWEFFGTLQVGYDRLIHDRILIGAFADYDFYKDADDSFSQETVKFYNQKVGSLSGDISLDNIWTVGGRLGILVTPRFLVYGLGGYSELDLDGSVTASFKDPISGPPVVPTSLTLNLPESYDGWTVGGGFEKKLHKFLSLKFEYRYSHFDGKSASISDLTYDDFKKAGWGKKVEIDQWVKTNVNAEVDDMDIHSVRAVLVWKLARDEAPVAPLK